ncbi:unnamed protein product [Scytosiphon promiscuus]
MHAAGSTSVSMPVSKKRCWTLSFKDVKRNDFKEADLLSAFRKRYTSVRRLSFRPPLPRYTFDDPAHPLLDRESLERHTTNGTEGRRLCVEVQFTGPQPIEGPACLMCELLDGSFVGAHPVQLDRGRKRKARAVVAGVAAPLASYGAFSPDCGSAGKNLDTQELFTTDAARGGAADCNASSVSSSAGFVPGAGDSVNACGVSGLDLHLAHNSGDGAPAPATVTPATATVPATKRIKRETEDDRGSTSSGDDAPTDPGPAPFYLSASSSTTSISSTASSDLDDLFDDLRDDASASTNEDMFSSALAAWGLSLEGPSGIAVAVDGEDGDDSPPPSRSACSIAATPASEQGLLTCDDPVRGGSAAAATASGGAHVSVDGLWCADLKEADGLLLPPEARRLCSSSWVPLPVHAGTVVADEGNGGVEVACVEDRGDQQQPPATAAARRQQARPPSERCDEERGTADVPATPVDATCGGERPPTPTGEGISVVWREEECDFHGHGCTAPPSTAAERVPPPASPSSPPTLPPEPCNPGNVARACQLELRGLGSVVAQGHGLEDLTVSARFYVHPDARAERVAGLVGVDADPASGARAIAAVPYPSIWQIWPEVGKMAHILAVEVDLQVELRTRSGDIIHTAPVVKVTYRRPATKTLVATA